VKRIASVPVAAFIALSAVAGAGSAPRAAEANEHLRLPEPSYPSATALWREGQAAEALTALAREVPAGDALPVDALLLRAAALADAGRAAEAEAAWQAAGDREAWIRTFAQRAVTESLAARGEPEAAAPLLDALLGSDASRHLDLLLQVADAHAAGGAQERAADHYRQALGRQSDGPLADRARLGLARALEAGGDVEAALSMLRDAQLRHRSAATFVTARTEARRLTPARSPFTEAQYHELVRRLRNASRFGLTLDLIEEWREAHPTTARPDRIDAERIATLYAQRANAAAAAAADRFPEAHPESSLTPGIRLTAFRLAVRTGDTARARRLGLDLWQERVPGASTEQRRDAALLLAAYLVAVGDVRGGLDLYRPLFRSARTADEQRDLLWRAGVAALRDGQNRRALTNLRGLLDREPGGVLALAGAYWLAVARERTGATSAAIEGFRGLAARYPNHFYGLQARARLSELAPGDNDETGDALVFPSLSVGRAARERAEFQAAMALARAGLTGDAARYLRRLLAERRGDRGLALLAARASAASGNHASAARIMAIRFAEFLERTAVDLPSDFRALAYPRPFPDEVAAAAEAHGVDARLLYALMRQESRFDPDARSPVGAIGLLQIMPYTAATLAASAGVGYIVTDAGIDEDALTDPRINTVLAARLMANLSELFDELPPIVASYNAGEERVARWWRAARDLGEDFFVDSIPYRETRSFVRAVLANYAAYRLDD